MEEAKANNVLPLNDLQTFGNPKDFEAFVQRVQGRHGVAGEHRRDGSST
jgi:hypothetical protein